MHAWCFSPPRVTGKPPCLVFLSSKGEEAIRSPLGSDQKDSILVVHYLIVSLLAKKQQSAVAKHLTLPAGSGFECQPGQSLLCVLGQIAELLSPRLLRCKVGMSQQYVAERDAVRINQDNALELLMPRLGLENGPQCYL